MISLLVALFASTSLAQEGAAAPVAEAPADAAPTSGPPPAVPDRKGSGALAVKTMREPYSAREVERGLLLPKGWLELGLGYDRKVARGAWTPEGERDEWSSAVWTYQTQHADIRYGLGSRLELYWVIPVHQAHLENEALGTDTRDWSFGDPRFGVKFELLEKQAPATSVALDLGYKGPAAKETPGTYIGGPLNVSGFVFTTGTPDLSVGLGAKQQLGPIGVSARVGYVHRYSAVVQYLIELENLQFLGRIKPGDLVTGDLDVGAQLGPLWLHGGGRFTHRALTRIGTTSGGISPSKNLDPVANSDGNAFDARAGLMFQISRGVDVDLHAELPIMGEDLQFFPIEDLQPTLGPTFGGTLELRY